MAGHLQHNIEDGISSAIRKTVAEIAEEVIKEAQEKLTRKVAEATAAIAINAHHAVNFERHGANLTITIRNQFEKGK